MKTHPTQRNTVTVTSILILILTFLLTACGEETATISIAATPTVTPKPTPTVKPIPQSSPLPTNTPEVNCEVLGNINGNNYIAFSKVFDGLGPYACLEINFPTYLSVISGEPVPVAAYTEIFIALIIPKEKLASFDLAKLQKLEGKKVRVWGRVDNKSSASSFSTLKLKAVILERPDQIQEITNP